MQVEIQNTQNAKTVGTDRLFVDCFILESARFANIIANFMRQCSHVHHMIEDWDIALLLPTHKKRDCLLPHNCNHVAVWSCIRKVN